MWGGERRRPLPADIASIYSKQRNMSLWSRIQTLEDRICFGSLMHFVSLCKTSSTPNQHNVWQHLSAEPKSGDEIAMGEQDSRGC